MTHTNTWNMSRKRGSWTSNTNKITCHCRTTTAMSHACGTHVKTHVACNGPCTGDLECMHAKRTSVRDTKVCSAEVHQPCRPSGHLPVSQSSPRITESRKECTEIYCWLSDLNASRSLWIETQTDPTRAHHPCKPSNNNLNQENVTTLNFVNSSMVATQVLTAGDCSIYTCADTECCIHPKYTQTEKLIDLFLQTLSGNDLCSNEATVSF